MDVTSLSSNSCVDDVDFELQSIDIRVSVITSTAPYFNVLRISFWSNDFSSSDISSSDISSFPNVCGLTCRVLLNDIDDV